MLIYHDIYLEMLLITIARSVLINFVLSLAFGVGA